MSVLQYEGYKFSDDEWLGDIPAHWSIARFRHKFHESAEKIEQEAVGPMLSVSGYRGIEVKVYDDENQRRSEEDLVGYRIVRKGQLVVNTMWLNYAGLGISGFEGHVSPAYRCYSVSPGLFLRYVHYLMRSERYVCGYTRLLTGIRPNSLQMSRHDLMEFPVLVPPFEEQIAIADFLDRETEKINVLIEEQRRLIELLKEKRQAVISHAVTKGLKPDVPMKPSGIDWLGEVPAHWALSAVRRIVKQIEQGWSPECYGRPAEDQEWGVVKSGCVNHGVFDEEDNKALPYGLEPIAEYEIHPRDILMSRASGSPELIGSVAFVTVTRPRLMLSDKTFRITPEPGVDRLFFVLAFNAKHMRAQIQRAISGADGLASNLPQSAIKSFYFARPPIEEQLAIVQHIQTQTAKIDSLIAESSKAIDLLQERRSALVSAVVTGKINVTTQVAKPVRSTWSTGFARQVLAAETLSRCNGPRMGRIKLQKLIHLCEYHAQLDEVRGTYSRHAAGPFAPQVMEDVREGLLQQRWFEEYKDESRYAYRALEKAGEHKQYMSHWKDKQARIDLVLNLLGGEFTRTCGIVSTLYAAWNDLLIEGKNPTDAEIIHEASSAERWHESKEKIATEKWPQALKRMRANGLVPVGYGTHTVHQTGLFTGARPS